ncbi:hypothetical protein [Streptomyces sp. NPDC001205]
MGEVWVATNNSDSWQAAGSKPCPVWFALVRAEEIRTVYLLTRKDVGTSVVAAVKGAGLDGTGDTTVLVSRSTLADDLPALPALFHLDLLGAMSQAALLDEDAPMYVRAEVEEESWRWRVYTHEQLRDRIDRQNMALEVGR